MNLEETLARWQRIKQLQAAGNASSDDRAFFRQDPDGFRLCGMRVDEETLDELLAIMQRKTKIEAEAKREARVAAIKQGQRPAQ